MSKKSIVLITKEFPYGLGEAFLENEIISLSKNFSEILIIACEVPAKENLYRPTPKNVEVLRINKKSEKIQKVNDILGYPFAWIRKDEDLNEEAKKTKNIKQKLFLKYFDGKSRRIMKEINKSTLYHSFVNAKKEIIIYSYWLFTTALIGVKISTHLTNKNTYLFTRAHRYDLYEEENPINYLPYRELLLRSYNMIYPVSKNGEQYLKGKYPRFSSKIQSSFLGTIDHGLGEASKGKKLKILSVSRVEPVKQVLKLAESIIKLDSEVKENIEWIHIGDGSEMKQLKSFVTEKMNGINVSLLGALKNKDVLQYYKDNEIDVLINVSLSEGLPVSIMESISFGVPVIATDVGGTKEIVISGLTGTLLTKNFTFIEINTHIIKLFEIKKNEYEKYMKLRETSRKYWENNFVAEENYQMLFDKVNEVFK